MILAASVSATTIITLASAIATVVAATATVWAVVYARRTVAEAQQGRAEAREAHAAQMAETSRATAAAAEQHRAEMDDREQFGDAEALNRRIVELERISELLLQIVDVARDEHRQPPERLGTAVTGSRLPAMLRRLQNAVAAFVALDGVYPERTAELARRGFGGGMQAITLVGEGIDALDEVQQIMLSVGVRHAGGPNVAPPT